MGNLVQKRVEEAKASNETVTLYTVGHDATRAYLDETAAKVATLGENKPIQTISLSPFEFASKVRSGQVHESVVHAAFAESMKEVISEYGDMLDADQLTERIGVAVDEALQGSPFENVQFKYTNTKRALSEMISDCLMKPKKLADTLMVHKSADAYKRHLNHYTYMVKCDALVDHLLDNVAKLGDPDYEKSLKPMKDIRDLRNKRMSDKTPEEHKQYERYENEVSIDVPASMISVGRCIDMHIDFPVDEVELHYSHDDSFKESPEDGDIPMDLDGVTLYMLDEQDNDYFVTLTGEDARVIEAAVLEPNASSERVKEEVIDNSPELTEQVEAYNKQCAKDEHDLRMASYTW